MTTLCWITGASAGLGRALSSTTPWPDTEIINVSRRPADGLGHLAADLSTTAGWDVVRRSFEERAATFEGDRVVFVMNAATIDPIGFSSEVDSGAAERAVLLNAAAPLVLGQAFLAATRDLDVDRALVQISSGAATSVYPGWSTYGPAKAAVDHWVRHVGDEEARRGRRVKVLSIAPGVVDTNMQTTARALDASDFPDVEKFRGLHEAGQLRPPEDAARDVWRLVVSEIASGSVVDVRTAS